MLKIEQSLRCLFHIIYMQESKDKAYLRHMLERVQKHKSSRRTANACNCDDTCSCDDINGTLGGGDNSTTARTRDGMQPKNHINRVAKLKHAIYLWKL